MARREEKEAALKLALSKAKEAERNKTIGSGKRVSHEELARYIALSTKNVRAVRPAEDYANRTYNRVRQVIGFIDHVFVRYPVPLFLYRSMLTHEGLELVFNRTIPTWQDRAKTPAEWAFRDWFFAVAKGDSFARVTKEVFTKKEAHWFLQAPPQNEILQNVLWARAVASGLPRVAADYLSTRLDLVTLTHLGTRLGDVLRFYVEAWPQMRGYDRDEITDYIRGVASDHTFSFKGRTFGSMRKLCHEWHQGYYSGHVREYISWANALPAWSTRHKSVVIRAEELTNNRTLAEEGRRQRHCVFSYTSMCSRGSSAIVSLRWLAVCDGIGGPPMLLDRLTIEVNLAARKVEQIRGKQNRSATDEEMKVVRHWAGDLGLTICQWAN